MGAPSSLHHTALRTSQAASHRTHTELESLHEKAKLHLYPRVKEPELLLCKFLRLPGKALAEQKLRKICKQMDNVGDEHMNFPDDLFCEKNK